MTLPTIARLDGTAYISGNAQGELLYSNLELSFWGGVNPATGEVIDRHHPLSSTNLEGKILAIPGSRGSCSGSGVLLELLVNGKGPAAIITSRPDEIIALGILVAQELFEKSIPLLMLAEPDFQTLISGDNRYIAIHEQQLLASQHPIDEKIQARTDSMQKLPRLQLTDSDRSLLKGKKGEAARIAMNIIVQMAQLFEAKKLIDINQVHIDGCVYTGQASLKLAQELRRLGGKVAVPTSLNAISVDYRNWKSQGVSADFAKHAKALADAYADMGAHPTFTCAPYLLDTAPSQGEQIAWAESNAVVFANSILGAKTMKYPDFLDICIALTGRAPCAGAHIPENRKATILITLDIAGPVDDAFYPILGYHIGRLSGPNIPAVQGLAHLEPDQDDLKAFGAAFATLSSASMFHIIGVTPEARTRQQVLPANSKQREYRITAADLEETWQKFNMEAGDEIELVSLGNPHFSAAEFAKLAAICKKNKKHPNVEMIITSSRNSVERAQTAGHIDILKSFGAKIITDTCWCMIEAPIISLKTKTILTNSTKYAHYGPGITGCMVRFSSLKGCVSAAVKGHFPKAPPSWLQKAP